MDKTSITFWGGLKTIGGNIAEIKYGTDRIIFDFGLVYDPAISILDAVSNRKDSYVLDLLKLSAIPAIPGIYSKKDLQGTSFSIAQPIPEEESTDQTAVFISHLHLDHMGAIDTISSNIPVYMTNESKQLHQVLEQVGDELVRKRDVKGISFHEPIHIGNITVTPLPVDHDIIGAASFLIATPDIKLLYTGDFRLHGAHPEYMEEWLDYVKNQKIDILLTEGTTVGSTKNTEESLCQNESDIRLAAEKIMKEHQGLALFNMYHRNVERIDQFLQAAKKANRVPVLEPETAYIAKKFLDSPEFTIFEKEHCPLSPSVLKDLGTYTSISTMELNENPSRYLFQNSYQNLYRLLDLNLKNGVYMHANGIPLGPFDPAYETLKSVLTQFNVPYYSLNVSGHAMEKDLLYITDQIQPKLVIPWHSRHPEQFVPSRSSQPVFLPELNKEYIFENERIALKK